jgi:hypothetical protein
LVQALRYLILPAALWPLGSTQPLTEMSTRNLPGDKRRPARKADNLTAICEPIYYKMWENRRLTTLCASTGCDRDNFTFLTHGVNAEHVIAVANWNCIVTMINLTLAHILTVLIPIQGPPHFLLIKVQKMSVMKGSLTRVYIQRQEDARINHVYPCLLEEEPTLKAGVTSELSQKA